MATGYDQLGQQPIRCLLKITGGDRLHVPIEREEKDPLLFSEGRFQQISRTPNFVIFHLLSNIQSMVH